MKKSETVKSKQEFTDLIKNGKFFKTNDYIIYYKESNLNKVRFGIAVSSKLGNAVVRNKLKRQTREIINNLKSLFKNNRDYIIMIRKGALTSRFQEKKDRLELSLKENNK